MKILLIEDDANKAKNVTQQLRDTKNSADITVSRSFQSGLHEAMTAQFDLLLLDMSLPRFDIGPNEDGYDFDFFAGREILFELDRRNIRLPTIVITQFETFGEGIERMTIAELDEQLRHEFAELYKGIIYYSASQSDWRRELTSKLEIK